MILVQSYVKQVKKVCGHFRRFDHETKALLPRSGKETFLSSDLPVDIDGTLLHGLVPELGHVSDDLLIVDRHPVTLRDDLRQ